MRVKGNDESGSLLPRIVSCGIDDIEELITSLDGSSKNCKHFIVSKKKLKVDGSITHLVFSFPVDVFKSSDTNKTSLDSLWSRMRDRIVILYQVVVFLGSYFSSSTKTTSSDVSDVMVELGLLQDDENITDGPLRSCWEEISFVNQVLTELSSVTLPLLNIKSNENKLTVEMNFINTLLGALRRKLHGMKSSVQIIEAEYVTHFTRYNILNLFCSSGVLK